MIQNVQSDTYNYAPALRAIGQELANLSPEYLEIIVRDNIFVAQGRSKTKHGQICGKNSLRKLWNKIAVRYHMVQAEPSLAPFERRYTQEDINRLTSAMGYRRTGMFKVPDIYGLGERLRTVGRIVDSQRGHLINLSSNANSVTFRYYDEQGQIQSQEHSVSSLFRIQQQHFLRKDPWDNSPRL